MSHDSTFNLATAFRPSRFSDVAGQRAVKAVLRAVVESERPAQQILLSGTSGTGKTTLARLLTGALFCTDRGTDSEPCGHCESCKLIFSPQAQHPDLVEMDAASFGGVDQIRDLSATALHAPLMAPWRVFIIDEAHGLTHGGGQAFLKLLEEPPEHTLFILATTDPQKLPLAVRSRCLQLEVLPPEPAEMASNLLRVAQAQGWLLDTRTCDTIISSTDPELGVRGTLMSLSKLAPALSASIPVSAEQLRGLLAAAPVDEIDELITSVVAGDLPATLSKVRGCLEGASSVTVRSQVSSRAYARLERAGERDSIILVELLSALSEQTRTPVAVTVAVGQVCAAHTPRSASPVIEPATVQVPEQQAPLVAETQAPKAPEQPGADSVENDGEAVEPEVAAIPTAEPAPPVEPESPIEPAPPLEEAVEVEAEPETESSPPTGETEEGPHPFDMPTLPAGRPVPRKAPESAPPSTPPKGPSDVAGDPPVASATIAEVGEPDSKMPERTALDLLNAVATHDARAALALRSCQVSSNPGGLSVAFPPAMPEHSSQSVRQALSKLREEGWQIDVK